MSERRVYLAQLLCPLRHCIIALANVYESQEEAKALESLVGEHFTAWCESKKMERHCALCGATEFHVEIGRSRFSTLKEALPMLKDVEAMQHITAERFKAQRN